jgi:hypothetical protein
MVGGASLEMAMISASPWKVQSMWAAKLEIADRFD